MITHLPCPACGSSDALTDYGDHTYCFSCGKHSGPEDERQKSRRNLQISKAKPIRDKEYVRLKDRKLSSDTCKKFRYAVSQYKGNPVHVATVTRKGKPCAQKLRFVEDKGFSWIGSGTAADLFGQPLWPANGQRLVITEGEIDAMSVAQSFQLRWPVVSLLNGAQGAAKEIRRQLAWVSGYNDIVLAFDADKPGRKAAEEVAAILPIGTVRIAEYPADCKDANDVIVKHNEGKLAECIHKAREWRPDGIVSASTLWDEVEASPERGYDYPWDTVSEWTYGLRKRELVVLGAGTGIGKTTFFKAMEYALAVEQGIRIGIIHLEESLRDTLLGLMSIHMKKPLQRPDIEVSSESKRKAFDEVTGNETIHIYDAFGACDHDTVKRKMRFFVHGLGCEFIFLDHLTALTDGATDDRSVNQLTRNIVSEYAMLCREMDFGMVAISHLRKSGQGSTPHEEGGRVRLDDMYGAAAIKQWASFVFGLERDQQAESSEERHRTTIRCLKDRLTGQSIGEMADVMYDYDSGLLVPADQYIPPINDDSTVNQEEAQELSPF